MSRAVPIGSFATRSEAEIVVGLLESQGIAASINADDAGGAYPFDLSGGAQVLVDESQAETAREALARRDEA
jgi:putative signal transducing protein